MRYKNKTFEKFVRVCFHSLLLVLLTINAYSQPQAVFKKYKADQGSLYNELLFASDDSTFFLAGNHSVPGPGTHVTKFDMWGTPIWSKRYTYTTYERYPEIHATAWGDLLTTTYPPNPDFRVRCADSNGNYKWGSITSDNVRNYHVESFDDGTLYLVNHGSAGPYIFKTDSSGVLKWKKSYYNVILNAFDFNEVVRAGATALLIDGYSSNYGTIVLMHIDSTGAVISSRALIPSVGITGLREMELYKISNNKIWISGMVGADAVIAESDSSGNIQWVRRISSSGCRIGTISPSVFPSGEIAFSALYTDTVNSWRGSCAGMLYPDGTIGHAFRFGSDDSLFGHDNVDAVALKNGELVVAAFERLLPVKLLITYSLPTKLFSDFILM